MTLLTISDLASQLKLKPSTIYGWAAGGKIPFLRIHGVIRFRPEEIEAWLASFRGHKRASLGLGQKQNTNDLDNLIERAKSEVYSYRQGDQTFQKKGG